MQRINSDLYVITITFMVCAHTYMHTHTHTKKQVFHLKDKNKDKGG